MLLGFTSAANLVGAPSIREGVDYVFEDIIFGLFGWFGEQFANQNAQDGLVRGGFQWIGFQFLERLSKRMRRRRDDK